MTDMFETGDMPFCRLPLFLERTGMSSRTFYRRVSDGVFHPRKDCKSVYVDMKEVRDWYESLPTLQDVQAREQAEARKRKRPT